MSLLPWNNIRLKTDSNFKDQEDQEEGQGGLNVAQEGGGRSRKVSYLSFVITEEEEEARQDQEDKRSQTEEDEDGNIFTRSLAPSAFCLELANDGEGDIRRLDRKK